MIETQRKLKVFFLEDNPDDVELELHELRRGGFDVTFDVARNRKEFLEKLPSIDADIILADYILPDITGIEAIHICLENKIDIPIMFITGVGGEQVAVDSLREGAIDYILKKNIVGLPGRVSRVLEIWAERKAKEKADAEREKLQELLFQSQKMESVGRLASGVAHDFNNIMTGILGFAELILQDTPEESPDHERLKTIITLCKRGAGLTRQLLIFGRRMSVEFKRININSFIEETADLIRHVVEEGIEVRLSLQDDIPAIEADSGQLTQVLINLTLNARDAMDGKGVLEFRTQGCSTVSPKGKVDEYLCLSVSDTGCGISEDNLPKIFDPFFTTKQVGKGTGLGLAIVYSIVNDHGGWIDVYSEKDKGTTFKIYLPAIPHDKLAGIPSFRDESSEEEIGILHGNETVLFAEDEDTVRGLIVSALRAYGYNVLSARNGEEAFEIYKSTPQKIDIVVADNVMPKKSGIELFNELRAIDPEIKFILITGYGFGREDSDIYKDIYKDFKAVLTKPCTPLLIAHFIRKTLDT